MDNMTVNQCLRVLLVEDSKVLTERLIEAIRQIAQVELVATADTEAGALAAVKRESVDVVILDLHLKQGTGFGVMRGLAAGSSKPRIVVLTNYDLPEYKNAAMALDDGLGDAGRAGRIEDPERMLERDGLED